MNDVLDFLQKWIRITGTGFFCGILFGCIAGVPIRMVMFRGNRELMDAICYLLIVIAIGCCGFFAWLLGDD